MSEKKLSESEKLNYCLGCYNNFYNDNNPYGVKRCWSFADMALVMKKEVSINQVPPWNQKAKLLPKCYRKQRYVYVGPDVTC